MENNNLPEAVPYIVHEGAMARNERMIKRLIVGLVISIILLFASNMAWLYVWSQYDTVSYDQDGEGVNNINTGSQGSIINGAKTKTTDSEE